MPNQEIGANALCVSFNLIVRLTQGASNDGPRAAFEVRLDDDAGEITGGQFLEPIFRSYEDI